MRLGTGDGFRLTVTVVGLAFLAVFFLYPVLRVFSASFLDGSGAELTLRNYAKVLSSAFYLDSMVNSLWIGVLATLITTLVATPLAFALARLPVAGKTWLMALSILPLVLPSFVGAYALLLLFGRAGIVTAGLHSLGIPFGSIYGTPGISGRRNCATASSSRSTPRPGASGTSVVPLNTEMRGADA